MASLGNSLPNVQNEEVKAAAARYRAFSAAICSASLEDLVKYGKAAEDAWNNYPGGIAQVESDKVTLADAYLASLAAAEAERIEREKPLTDEANVIPSWWDRFLANVAEIPDRTSPDDDPNAMVATAAELTSCAASAIGSEREGLLSWAISRWRDEVEHRPAKNVHRNTIDNTWRQVIRKIGGTVPGDSEQVVE